jgi:hypothetical protein
MIKMTVEAANPTRLDGLAPFLDFPAAAIRSPAVPVKTGEFLRISVWVKRSIPTPQGAGGLIIRDSIGGEALQFISNEPIPAPTKVVLYRRAPSDGDFTVTLGLAGFGEAVFDTLAVERVEAPQPADPPSITQSTRPDQSAAVRTAEGGPNSGRSNR